MEILIPSFILFYNATCSQGRQIRDRLLIRGAAAIIMLGIIWTCQHIVSYFFQRSFHTVFLYFFYTRQAVSAMMAYRSIECSNARNSIGNGFPVQKYVGAMVRKSIRVVLVAENDLLEVASDPDWNIFGSKFWIRNFSFTFVVFITGKFSNYFYVSWNGSDQLENAAHILLVLSSDLYGFRNITTDDTEQPRLR